MIRFGLGSTSGSGQLLRLEYRRPRAKGLWYPWVPRKLNWSQLELTDSIQPGSDPAVHYVTVNNIGDGTLSMVFTPSDDWMGCTNEMQIVPAGESVRF